MKIIQIILYTLISTSAFSQDYFSRIIPTEDNTLVKNLGLDNGKYYISTDFFSTEGVRGGLIIVTEEEDEKVKFNNMDLSADPILVRNDLIYFLGENPNREGDSTFFISAVENNTFNQKWYKEYTIEHPKLNPRSILEIDNKLFVVNLEIKTLDGNYPQETSVFVFDLDGNLQDIRKYNTDNWASFAWTSFVSSDKALIMSNIIASSEPGTYSQLLKTSPTGEILWNYEGTERLDNGAVPTWATELSDSTIVQTYYVDRRDDLDFIINDWFPEPNKLIWLSKEGELIKEKYIITGYEDFLFLYGLKAGRGDYFYSYGYYEDRRPVVFDQFYAHLTKFSNEGDTIWSRNYQHPSYPEGNITHNIKDILEEENGDLTILADISPVGAKKEVWLFRVDSEGCFVNEACEDMTVITSIEEEASTRVHHYPNPTTGKLYIEEEAGIIDWKILDDTGQVVKQQNNASTIRGQSIEIDLSNLHKGLYIIQLKNAKNILSSKKVIKL